MSKDPTQLDRIENKLDGLVPLVHRHNEAAVWVKAIMFGFFTSIVTLYYKIFGGT